MTQPAGTGLMDGELRIEVIDRPEDIEAGFDCAANAFGNQAHDTIWMGFYPEWNKTGPEGRTRAAGRLIKQFHNVTYDSDGNANTVFLKATLPDSQGQRIVVGMAIWLQLSMVEGRGNRPSDDLRSSLDLEMLYPNNEAEQRYICQLYRSLVKRRVEVTREKETSQPPAIFHLGSCSVDPTHQRKGIATKLVQWGLDEAKRRGGLEATTEASSMGRHVYQHLGFHGEGPDIEYHVDSEFLSRERPSNLFMRTGASQ
ncbi:hypothetical protein F5Y13DRAFT_175809 [Hypoxylon sp. FL1857]|nr:hypothetical protein F5Y13DRAFT_175809 [Hypoxylon sp. FL1857]